MKRKSARRQKLPLQKSPATGRSGSREAAPAVHVSHLMADRDKDALLGHRTPRGDREAAVSQSSTGYCQVDLI